MKKILLIIMLMFGMLGCVSDSEYINTLKQMTFEDGITVEQYVKNAIDAETMYVINEHEVKELLNKYSVMRRIYMTDDLEEFLRIYSKDTSTINIPGNLKYDWEIEGKTDKGKIVKVTSRAAYVTIEVKTRGDYIETSTDNIKVYNNKNVRISQPELAILMGILEKAKKVQNKE